MAVDYGILERTPSIASRFMAGQQEAAAEQDRNMLRQMQMEQMGAQRENILAQREQRLAQADERRAAEMRRQQRQTFLEGLSTKMAEGGYKLDRPTLGQVLQFGMQTGEDSLIKLATEGMKALDEEERDKAEMARFGLGPSPAAPAAPAAPANAFAVPSLAEGAAAPAPVNAMVDRGRVQQMIMSPSPRVRQMGQALAGTLEKPEASPADVKAYEYARGQGFTGSFFDFKRELAKAGRPPAQPREPREPSAPVAVVDEATGNIVYVTREQALGRTPASAIQSLPPKEIQKREATYPQATQAVKGFESKSQAFIKDLVALRDHPGLAQITGLVAGRVPGLTAEGRAAQALYDKVVAKGGFQALQDMRDASKTGGALGNVSNAEGKQLIASAAAIDRRQDAKDVQAAINQFISDIEGSQVRMREAYDDTYSYRSQRSGAASQPAGGATGGWSVVR